jgi:LPS-assembly lipoprotein
MSRGGWSIWWSEAVVQLGTNLAGTVMAGTTGGTPAAAMPRRALLRGAAGLLALGAGGCGFQPVYGGGAAGDAAVGADMAATRVPVIADRFGQLLRRGLVQRLGTGAGTGAANGAADGARWELLVGPSLAAEGIGIQQDGAASRVRTIATANWTLVRVAPREVVASGFERTTDAFNIQGNQFFAADSSREAMERRLAEQLADEVVIRVAMQFRSLRAGVAPQRIEPVRTVSPLPQAAPPGTGLMSLPNPGQGVIGGPTGGIGPRDGIR